MENVLDSAATVEGLADILLEEFEARLVPEMSDVLHPSGQEIVSANHGVAFAQQRIANVRADETRPACHKYTHKYVPSMPTSATA